MNNNNYYYVLDEWDDIKFALVLVELVQLERVARLVALERLHRHGLVLADELYEKWRKEKRIKQLNMN